MQQTQTLGFPGGRLEDALARLEGALVGVLGGVDHELPGLAAVQDQAQEALAADHAMGDAGRHVVHLAGAQVLDAELGLVRRVAAKLQPQLVVVQPAVEAALLALGVVDLDVEDRRLVELRAGAALAGDALEEVKGAQLGDAAPLRRHADQRGVVALDQVALAGRVVPEQQALAHGIMCVGSAAVPRPARPARADYVKLRVAHLLVDAEERLDGVAQPREQPQAVAVAAAAVGDAAGNQQQLGRPHLEDAVLGLERRVAGELEEQLVVVAVAAELGRRADDALHADAHVVVLPEHQRLARLAQHVERAKLRRAARAAPHGADDRLAVALDPGAVGRAVPPGDELAHLRHRPGPPLVAAAVAAVCSVATRLTGAGAAASGACSIPRHRPRAGMKPAPTTQPLLVRREIYPSPTPAAHIAGAAAGRIAPYGVGCQPLACSSR